MKNLFASALARKLLIILPLAVGIATVVILVRSRGELQRQPLGERVTPVRVVRAALREVVPSALAYGTVKPGRVWLAVAEVAGRIVEKHERAEEGALIEAGELLARIDPAEVRLVVEQAEATLTGIQAKLTELEIRLENTRQTLEIERRALALAENELERKRELIKEGTVSSGEVDQEERRHLQQLTIVSNLENTLRLIPAERASLEAEQTAQTARLESARLDLEQTEIRLPFTGRIARADFEPTQFVRVGQELAEIHGIEVSEIPAQISIASFRHLLPEEERERPLLADLVRGEIMEEFGLRGTVRLRIGDFHAEWEARVDRISGVIDPETRTLGVVVAVDRSYEKVKPGLRPPLVQGMFCEVELSGRPKPLRIVIPRSVLRGSELFVVADGRLERRRVEIDFPLGDFLCLRSGLQEGDLVVVTDLIPAVDGMLLDPRVDEAVEAEIQAAAKARAAGR